MRKHDMSNICVMKNKGRNNETPTFQCQNYNTPRVISPISIFTQKLSDCLSPGMMSKCYIILKKIVINNALVKTP